MSDNNKRKGDKKDSTTETAQNPGGNPLTGSPEGAPDAPVTKTQVGGKDVTKKAGGSRD
jgi:hypothetical protein